MMRIIGQPSCTVQALDQSESERSKVILDFSAKFFLPGESESTVVFHRIFVTPPDTVAAFAMSEEDGKEIVAILLELLLVPTLDEIVDPIFTALAAVSTQTRDRSLGLKATVNIDITVQTLPPPPRYLTDVAHLYFNFDHLYLNLDDRDDDQVRFVPASESSIRTLETVRVSEGAEEECSVCLEDLAVGAEATRLPCSHTFHGDCILKWLNTSNFCPLCRFQINT